MEDLNFKQVFSPLAAWSTGCASLPGRLTGERASSMGRPRRESRPGTVRYGMLWVRLKQDSDPKMCVIQCYSQRLVKYYT